MAFFLLLCILVSVAIVSYAHHAIRRRRQGCAHGRHEQAALKLPPGSMGLPYVGETLQLYSQDPSVFLSSKQKRYGEIFKTHLLGCPCVMLASPEAARFVLVSRAHLFKPTYPRSKERLIGPSALFFHQGDYHLRLRRLVQGPLGPEALRKLVPDIEAAVRSTLAAWADGDVASTFHAMKRLSFDVGIVTIFGGRLDERRKEELRRNYAVVEKGYNSFPNSFPGTLYYKAIQARRRLNGVLSDVVHERRERGEHGDDLLGCLMRSRAGGDDADDEGALLTDEQVADNVIGVLFAAQDTTASVLTWIVKYLHDRPKLLEAVRAEHAAIHEANDGGRRPLTWAQTRSMTLTHRVRAIYYQYLLQSLQLHVFLCRVWLLMLPVVRAYARAGDFGEPKDGQHHLLHVQGGRGRRGVQRVSYPQGVEGDAALQEHPSQPGLLPGSTQVRPFAIQGGAAAEHLHAVRERGARVPGERAGQARDAGAHPPPGHRLQVRAGLPLHTDPRRIPVFGRGDRERPMAMAGAVAPIRWATLPVPRHACSNHAPIVSYVLMGGPLELAAARPASHVE